MRGILLTERLSVSDSRISHGGECEHGCGPGRLLSGVLEAY
jgi:hypothetical protein